MRHITLEAWTDEYGNLGLIVDGIPRDDQTMSDIDGGLIAHDLLEHQNGIHAIGTVPDEIEALGGLWQVRGRHADFCHDDPSIGSAWTPEQNTILDLTRLAVDAYYYGWTPRIGRYNTKPHFEDETFIGMLDWVRPRILDGLQYANITGFPIEAYLENALHLLRMGYRKAERRFGPRYDGIEQFRAIKSAIKPHTRHLEFEGQRFRLSYGKGHARVIELHDPFDLH